MIGIIGAMTGEVEGFIAEMSNVTEFKKAGITFYKGCLYGKDAVAARSGIGKVNAAVAAQIMADLYNVDIIINSGVAGALSDKLDIGDIVISTDAIEHDMDATGFGYKKGQIPQMPVWDFKADENDVKHALEAMNTVNRDIHAYAGRIVSGDVFISDKTRKDELTELYNAMCTEMEGAAVAHTAYLNGIRFLIIRAISDKADGSANMDYEQFEKLAILHTRHFMKAFFDII